MQIHSPTMELSRAVAPSLDATYRQHRGHGARTERLAEPDHRSMPHRGGAERLTQAVDDTLASFRTAAAPTAEPPESAEATSDAPAIEQAAEQAPPPSLGERLNDFVDALYGALRDIGGGRNHGHHDDHEDQGRHRGHAYGHHDDHGWRGRGHGSLSMRLEALAAALTPPPAATDAAPAASISTLPVTPEIMPPAIDGDAGTQTPPTIPPAPATVDGPPVADGEVPPVLALPMAPESMPAPDTDTDPLTRLRQAFAALVGTPGAEAAPDDAAIDPLRRFVQMLAEALRPGGRPDDDVPATGLLIDVRA